MSMTIGVINNNSKFPVTQDRDGQESIHRFRLVKLFEIDIYVQWTHSVTKIEQMAHSPHPLQEVFLNDPAFSHLSRIVDSSYEVVPVPSNLVMMPILVPDCTHYCKLFTIVSHVWLLSHLE